MLFEDDVVADLEAETGALARGVGCKEWIENLGLDLLVADADFYLVAAISGGGT